MAFMSSMALGVRLQVHTQGAVNGMRRLGQTVDNVKGRFQRAGLAAKNFQKSVQGVQMVSAAVNLALGVMAFKAANFEQGMSGVQAVLLANKEDMTELTEKAKELGRTTVFSASQAADGMNAMARAGFDNIDIMDGMKGVMDAAAAEGMDLGRATSIVADTIKGMGLTAKDTTLVADTLALASARANTDISGLGEAMKYVATTANVAGIPLHDITGAVAALQDAGLKGSMAGTALSTMLTKMAAPSNSAQKSMEKLGITFKDSNGDLLSFRDQMKQLEKGFKNAGGSADKLALANQLFGIRGQKAAMALVKKLEDPKRSLVDMMDMLGNATGSAEKMANIRLDNLKGQMTLLGSALEGVSIELMTGVNAGFTTATKSAATFFQEVATGMAGAKEDTAAAQFGIGFKAVFDTAAMIVGKITGFIGKIGQFLESIFGPELGAMIGKIAGGLTLFLAVVGPVAIAVGAFAAVAALSAKILVPVIAAVKILALLFAGGFATGAAAGTGALDGFLVTLMGWVEQVKAFFTGMFTVIRDQWSGIVAAFQPAIESLKRALQSIMDAFAPLFNTGESGALSMGEAFGYVVTAIAHVIAFVVNLAAVFVELYVSFKTRLIGPMLVGFKNIFGGFADLITGATSVGNAIARIFGGLGDILIAPIKGAVGFLLSTVRTILLSGPGRIAAETFGIDVDAAAGGLKDMERKVTNFSLAPARQAKAVTADILKESKKQKAATASPEVAVTAKVTAPKTPIKIQNTLKVNGKQMAVAQAENDIEIQERAGFADTAWQRRQVLERGVRSSFAE